MSEKNFIKLVLTSIIILLLSVYVLERSSNTSSKMPLDIYYTHANKKEVLAYKKDKVDSFTWYELDNSNGKLNDSGEKFVIVKFTLDDVYAQNRRFYARMRNKLAEVYIDGILIQRNGAVAENNIYNSMTTYYDISIPITHKYEGKEVVIFIEAPTKFDSTSIEAIDVLTTTDVFQNKGVFEITMVLFTFITFGITGLAALYLYWMRLNFTNKFYRVLIPAWALLGFVVFSLPYYNINYPQLEQRFSFYAYTLGITSLFLIMYGLRKTVTNVYFVWFMNFFIIILWMAVATTVMLVYLDIVNWSFVQYCLETLFIIMAIPMFVAGYINARYDYEIFRVPLKIFWGYNLVVTVSMMLMYLVFKSISISVTLNVGILLLLIGMIVFLSYIINVFHSSLFKEMKNVISESEVYDSIDISRDNIFYDKQLNHKETKKHEYNNLSVKYAKALINAEMYACSVILKPKPNSDEIEVVYCKNTFENTMITQEEARYYLLAYEKIFGIGDITTVRRGKNIYLGFKQDNLYYFMIISPKEMVGDLKFKALVSYTNSIKNTAYNYVITNYIERAQSDVIRSFGETIEARISSNNIIGITDRFVEFIARAMGKSEGEVQTLKTASYIKNIGTIIMSDQYVKDFHTKSDAEVIEAYRRATYGYDILGKFDDSILSTAAIMSKYQFENYDGTGYLGIKREEIPDESKIIKLAVGMTSALRYEINTEKLFEEILSHVESERFAGQFSPYLLVKVRANSHLFKESFDVKDEKLMALIKDQKEKHIDDFIM